MFPGSFVTKQKKMAENFIDESCFFSFEMYRKIRTIQAGFKQTTCALVTADACMLCHLVHIYQRASRAD